MTLESNLESITARTKGLTLLLFGLVALQSAAFAQPSPSSPSSKDPAPADQQAVIKLAIPELEGTFLYKFSALKFTEAFKRLGYRFELHALPSERALRESNSGHMDGEAGRIRFNAAMSARYPNLVEVNEPTFMVRIGAYSADASVRCDSWQDLLEGHYLIGYQRGIKLIESKLIGRVDPEKLYSLTDIRQGLRMMARGRIDMLVALQTSVESVLLESEFMDTDFRLAGVIEAVPVLPYLNKKHRALAPQLAATLKSMKADGTLDRLAREAKLATMKKSDP
jgi:polar amino acid transport system substrate-binding protein